MLVEIILQIRVLLVHRVLMALQGSMCWRESLRGDDVRFVYIIWLLFANMLARMVKLS